MGKYDPLRAYLSGLSSDEAELSFGKIESLVGPLPKSARSSKGWWVSGSAVQALAWRNAGWHVKAADEGREMVTFVRGVTAVASGSTSASSSSSARVEDARRWPVLVAAVVTAIGTAAATIVGLAVLPRWAIFLISLDLSAVLTLITSAITDAKYRVVSLWSSNGFLIALVAGVAIYNLVLQNGITANVVPNADVTLSYEAGSPADRSDPNGTVLPAGRGETATCYSVVNGKVWLYFHFSDRQVGWAPFADFHYDPGFAHRLPSTCT